MPKPPKSNAEEDVSTVKPATSLDELKAQASAAPSADPPVPPVVQPAGSLDELKELAAGGVTATSAADSSTPATHVTLQFPLPVDVPDAVLDQAVLIVRAKAMHGRRRAGHDFSRRNEKHLRYRDLTSEQVELLTSDPELVVAFRVPQPA